MGCDGVGRGWKDGSCNVSTHQNDPPACRRCGICCKKGGPALHRCDRELVDGGEVPLRHLVTIRKGEPAWDNVHGRLLPAAGDIIKVRSRTGGRTCVYYDLPNAACRIYARRPLECRVLDCRDTRAIEAVYEKERLTRRDLLEGVSALWELVAEHQRQCAYEKILPLAQAVRICSNFSSAAP
jgi:Fe-S-cluster containining protein